MKIVISEQERGFLFKNGRFIRMLKAGKYNIFPSFGYTANAVMIDDAPINDANLLTVCSQDPNFLNSVTQITVPDEHVALHYINERFAGFLETGEYAFWSIFKKHSFKMVDMADDSSLVDIPSAILNVMPERICQEVIVEDGEVGLLFLDRSFVRELSPGTYRFWQNGRVIKCYTYDLRTIPLEITGQEILTADKVSLRVNFVCTFSITDPVKLHTEIKNYEHQIYTTVQLALRELLGRRRFDEILELKDSLGVEVLEIMRKSEERLFVNFINAGIKDIVLPKEIRDIMNTVLEAEKKAQASVITRREEIASTRSLLNTARLMDENTTLYKLKELEYLEKICDRVETISVGNASGLLEQLRSMITR